MDFNDLLEAGDTTNLYELIMSPSFVYLMSDLLVLNLNDNIEYNTNQKLDILLKNEHYKEDLQEFLNNSSKEEMEIFTRYMLNGEVINAEDIHHDLNELFEDINDDKEDDIGYIDQFVDDHFELNEFEERLQDYRDSEEPLVITGDVLENYEAELLHKFRPHIDPYVFDQDLPEDLINMYEVGQLLYHPDFLYATKKELRCKTNCRFKIFSAEEWNYFTEIFSDLSIEKRQILVNSYAEVFKVIDVYKKNGITQVTLLNMPIDTENYIRINKPEIENMFAEYARETFDRTFKYKMTISARNLNYSSQAVGAYKTKDGYKFYTKSDICEVLVLYSSLYNMTNFDFFKLLLLHFKMDELYDQYLRFKGKHEYSDENIFTYYNLKYNLESPDQFADEIMSSYMSVNKSVLENTQKTLEKRL